jgi:ribose 5-phosphate isomerase RpiB
MKIEIFCENINIETKNNLKLFLNASYESYTDNGGWKKNKMFIYSHTANKKNLKKILKDKTFNGYKVNETYSDAYLANLPRGIYIYTKKNKLDDGIYTWHDSEMTRHIVSFKFSKTLFFSDDEIKKEQQQEKDDLFDIFDIK